MNKLQTKYIDDFRNAFSDGIASIVKAAQIYVDAIDDNPHNAELFQAQFMDTIPASAWSGFEAVGRKWMHPKLLLGGGGKYAAKIKRLPYSTQERVFGGDLFELLIQNGETLRVDVRHIAPEQVEQLIDGNHIRTLPEQRAFLGSKTVTEEAPPPMPYVIRGGKVSFHRGVTLNKQEIRRILQEI